MRSLIVFTVFVVISAFSFGYDWASNPGDGSAGNPYQISTPEHLISIGSDLNLLDKNFILTSDIVFDPNNNPAHVFTDSLIAPDPDNDGVPVFSGHFDGAGHKIINLKIISSDRNTGLFGRIQCSSADQMAVENLTFVTPIILGLHRVGPLVGLAEECTIQNCHTVGGTVGDASSYVAGGLIGGGFYTNLKDCSASADVTGYLLVGGLSGSNNSSTFNNCSASGDVTGSKRVGGLVGDFKLWYEPELNEPEKIINCYATGDVHSDVEKCGGLIGYVTIGLIRNCYATGRVTGAKEVGGLIGCTDRDFINGSHSVKIDKCFATGNVEGQNDFAGGFIGYSHYHGTTVTDCYAKGNVRGDSYVGGFIGDNWGTCAYSYSVGLVEGVDLFGGFAGRSYYGKNYFCYWDRQTSGLTESDGGESKTTAELKSISTYKGWGDNIWVLDSGDYPHLAWEGTAGSPIIDIRTYSGGSGTAEDPYRIATTDDLIAAGTFRADWDKHFVLVNDITFDPANFSDPNINYQNSNFNKIGFRGLPFRGYFNGNFHIISNLRNIDNQTDVGLFGVIDGKGPDDVIVENLIIDSPEFLSPARVGGLAGGVENAKIIRCGVRNFNIYGETGLSNAGGLTGCVMNSTAVMCSAEGRLNINNPVSTGHSIGGFAGSVLTGTVENCYSVVTFKNCAYYASGFTGEGRNCEIRNCYAVPTNTSWDYDIAGFIYHLSGSVSKCYNQAGNGISSGYGGSGLSESMMKDSVNFNDWDFVGESVNGDNEIWRMCVDGVDYPRLSWEFAVKGDFACGDGVDVNDLQVLAENWLTDVLTGVSTFNYSCDANGDGQINMKDFEVLSSN